MRSCIGWEGFMIKLINMLHLWDYDKKELKKTRSGRLKILERKINFGVYLKDKERISLKELKKNWNNLKIEPGRRNFFKFLLWGK